MKAQSPSHRLIGAKAAALGGALAMLAAIGLPVKAQDGGCQLVESPSEPARQILTCPSGPKIEAETKADVRVIDQGKTGHPTSATIDTGAALIEIPPGYPGGFQVTAPRAVATVRGTVWVVDVKPDQTSVFVMRGEVAVQRPGQGGGVTLKEGDGVDVGADDGKPLDIIRWPPERISALLARFGR